MSRPRASDEPPRDERPGDEPPPDEQASDEQPRDDQPAEFDWGSPRWRETDEHQADAERSHRFRDDSPPAERGALDRGNSVGRPKVRKDPGGEPKA